MTDAPDGIVADGDRHVLVAFLIQLGTALIRSGEAVRNKLSAIAKLTMSTSSCFRRR